MAARYQQQTVSQTSARETVAYGQYNSMPIQSLYPGLLQQSMYGMSQQQMQQAKINVTVQNQQGRNGTFMCQQYSYTFNNGRESYSAFLNSNSPMKYTYSTPAYNKVQHAYQQPLNTPESQREGPDPADVRMVDFKNGGKKPKVDKKTIAIVEKATSILSGMQDCMQGIKTSFKIQPKHIQKSSGSSFVLN